MTKFSELALSAPLLRALNETGRDLRDFSVSAVHLAALIAAVKAGRVNHQAARKVFAHMVATGDAPEAAIAASGLEQISDEARLAEIVRDVLAAQPKAVADWRAGKDKVLHALKGEVMRATRGTANPALVESLLLRRLADS